MNCARIALENGRSWGWNLSRPLAVISRLGLGKIVSGRPTGGPLFPAPIRNACIMNQSTCVRRVVTGAAAIALASASYADEQRFTPLGTLPAAQPESHALGVSADGSVVVGYCHTDSGDRACRWFENRIEELGGFPVSTTFSVAHAVSANGTVIVGQCETGGVPYAFRWENGAVLFLFDRGDGPKPSGEAWAVDAAGERVAGITKAGDQQRGRLWKREAGGVVADSLPGGPYAITPDGHAVVGAMPVGDFSHAYLWSDGAVRNLGGLRALANSTAFAISADGAVVVGESESPFGTEAFRWREGVMTGLGGLSPGHDFLSSARGVSGDGRVVVGWSQRDDESIGAFVWDAAHGMRWLDDIVTRACRAPLGRFVLQEATAVSADGTTIVGNGRNARGKNEAWRVRLPVSVFEPAARFKAEPSGSGMDMAAGPALGAALAVIGDLHRPAGLAIDGDDRIYVAEADADRVGVFDASGQLLWRLTGPPDSPLRQPAGLAIDGRGDLWVADQGNSRVCVLTREGALRREFGQGTLIAPQAIALAVERVLVADIVTGRVETFDLNGRSLGTYESPADAVEGLIGPRDLAVAPDGRVFVTDQVASRVSVFDVRGRWVAAFGEHGDQAGLLAEPAGVQWFASHLYVVDCDNHRLQVYSPAGEFQFETGRRTMRPREAGGRLHFPRDLRIAPSGRFAVVSEPVESRCQVVELIAVAPGADAALPVIDTAHEFSPQGSIACASSIVAVPLSDRNAISVFRLTNNGAALLTDIGGHGTAFGQFRGELEVALESPQALFVLDSGNRRLQRFALALSTLAASQPEVGTTRFIKALRLPETKDPARSTDQLFLTLLGDGFAFGSEQSGDYFLAARDFRSSPTVVARQSTIKSARISTMAAGRHTNRTAAIDLAAGRVTISNPDGSVAATWGRRGQGPGEFIRPVGLAFGLDGAVYVSDAGVERVQKFSDGGALLKEWGRPGVGRGEFCGLAGLAVDGQCRVIAVETGTHRCQIFDADGNYAGVFGAPLYCMPARLSD